MRNCRWLACLAHLGWRVGDRRVPAGLALSADALAIHGDRNLGLPVRQFNYLRFPY